VSPPFVYKGVTVIFPVIGPLLTLTPWNEGIKSVPLAAKPIDVFEFVHGYDVPVPLNETMEELSPLHNVKSGDEATPGVGLMVYVNDCVVPGQLTELLVIIGVTTRVDVITVEPVFTAVNDEIFPKPLAAKPIPVFEFVQVYELADPANITAALAVALHSNWSIGSFTSGLGLTVMV